MPSNSVEYAPFPPVYSTIFVLLEPLGLLGGAAFAILFPVQFHEAYLGRGWLGDVFTGHRASSGHAKEKAVMVAGGMGSCMLIIGLLSLTVLPRMQKVLKGHPALHEQILKTYLAALSIGDIAHIAVTLFWAPASVRWHPSTWTILLWGNIAGTALPALARIAWFTGVGRSVTPERGSIKRGGSVRR